SVSSRCGAARSTLFPYTTLFRSSEEMPVFPETLKGLCCELYTTIVRNPNDADLWHRLAHGLGALLELPLVLVGEYGSNGTVTTLDRKSTRLNSSHVKISYAVFCL